VYSFNALDLTGIGYETKAPNFPKIKWQNMLAETPQKLMTFEYHHLLLRTVLAIVFIGKSYATVINFQDSPIANSNLN
jgi:hypothetical protein